MIKTFRSKALRALWVRGDASKIAPQLMERVTRRLDALDAAGSPEAMNIPGFDFHKLRGTTARYSVHVNGPWCVTFEWDGEHATQVDLENYH